MGPPTIGAPDQSLIGAPTPMGGGHHPLRMVGIEPTMLVLETSILPLNYTPLMPMIGIEPITNWLKASCSTIELHRPPPLLGVPVRHPHEVGAIGRVCLLCPQRALVQRGGPPFGGN